MKKQITAAVMMLSMIAPAMANGLDNQAFEDQV
ncbi:wall-associated protein precursor, partial [Neisseria meningitidis]|nr:wall-associated protein precursor [Neisseria meningitidis]